VAHPETTKPASASHAEPVSKVGQIGRPLNSRNTPNADQLQATDDAGESDLAFFAARPHARHRIRERGLIEKIGEGWRFKVAKPGAIG
jgi:hypothetical protein